MIIYICICIYIRGYIYICVYIYIYIWIYEYGWIDIDRNMTCFDGGFPGGEVVLLQFAHREEDGRAVVARAGR